PVRARLGPPPEGLRAGGLFLTLIHENDVPVIPAADFSKTDQGVTRSASTSHRTCRFTRSTPLDRRAPLVRQRPPGKDTRMRANKLGVAFVVLLAALCTAGAATAKDKVKTGGTLNVDLTTDVDYTDPALSYLSTGWELEYATGLKLMNYPDGLGPRTAQLVP